MFLEFPDRGRIFPKFPDRGRIFPKFPDGGKKCKNYTIAFHPFFERKITKSKYGSLSNKHTKNTLRTLQARKGVKFKNIEPKSKITGSYKKKRV